MSDKRANMDEILDLMNNVTPVTSEILELVDPNPDIYRLFRQFNAQFFWNTLGSVEVKWSNRMTSCAGICTFHPRNHECVITLSVPLLKLRPRKDLVETLLHEMIHAYLFLTNNDRDRDGHGPNFCKHMRRINNEAGTNITIYHNFNNEVRLYQQHWWKCNGPCQYRAPYFGMVRRAMNRAPGRSDFWWADHQKNCNGQFIKIKEPENYKSKKSLKKNDKMKNDKSKLHRNITDWFSKETLPTITPKSTTTHSPKILKQSNNDNDKASTSESNNSTNSSGNFVLDLNKFKVQRSKKNDNVTFKFSEILGGSNSGQSNLLKKFQYLNNDSKTHQKSGTISSSKSNIESSSESSMKSSGYSTASSEYSIASSSSKYSTASSSRCSTTTSSESSSPSVNESANNSSQQRGDAITCSMCGIPITLENLYRHIDACLINNTGLIDEFNNNIDNNNGFESILLTLPRRLSMERENNETDFRKRRRIHELIDVGYVNCPICNIMFPSADINQHLDACLEKSNNTGEVDTSTSSNVTDNNSIISISSSYDSESDVSIESLNTQSSMNTNTTGKNDIAKREKSKKKCLICYVTLKATESLNDHLEECIGNLFESTTVINDDGNDDDIVSIKDDSVENKYPCPVCMQVIPENFMNQHLDMCLKNE